MQKLAVIGAGAFGSALSITFSKFGRDVKIWAYEKDVAEEINSLHSNSSYLAGVEFPEAIKAYNDFEFIKDAELILIVTPSSHTVRIAEQMKPFYNGKAPILICTKGMDVNGEFFSAELEELFPGAEIGAMSGPMFAIELVGKAPTAATCAFKNEKVGHAVIEALSGPYFRPYYSPDVIGVQVGGMVKNIIAIGSGIISGADIGRNAQAAVITRGLFEIIKFATACGADPSTLMGLSGIGDLILTANSSKSRNFSLGEALGKGEKLSDIMAKSKTVFEGVNAVTVVAKKARALSIEMPICFVIEDILAGKSDVAEVIKKLLARPLKDE